MAVIGDVRLVVVQARRAVAAHAPRQERSSAALQRKLAIETREVYAPLANRLGVWQVKWELEDLAFRYLQPAEYRHIAAALKVRRTERERYIEELKTLLQRELRAAGIEARIEAGRSTSTASGARCRPNSSRSSSSWTFARRACW